MAPGRRQRDAGLAAPVDDADGQMEQEVDDPRRGVGIGAAEQPAERLAELLADAVEAGDRAEQGVEERAGACDSTALP